MQNNEVKTWQEAAQETMDNLDIAAELKRDRELSETLSIIENGLEQERAEGFRYQIPERYFVGIYLPWFAGEDVNIPQADGTSTLMTSDHWLAVSGHYNNEVDVIDVSGKVLFTVPPLVNSMKILTNYDKVNYSLTSVFQRYKQEADVYPTAAKENLRYELERSVAVEDGDMKDKDALRWYEIFKRYGYIDSVEAESKTEVKEDSATDDESALASMMILR